VGIAWFAGSIEESSAIQYTLIRRFPLEVKVWDALPGPISGGCVQALWDV
jgi:hypothetical protein